MRCFLENARPDLYEIGTSPVRDLSCSVNGTNSVLSWTNRGNYDNIEVRKNGNLVATLSGNATGFTHNNTSPGSNRYRVVAIEGGQPSAPAPCDTVVGDICSKAISVSEGTTTFDTTGALTDGPSEPDICDVPADLGERLDPTNSSFPSYVDLKRVSVSPAGTDTIRIKFQTRGPILSPGNSNIPGLSYTAHVDLDDAQSYDPATGTWTTLPSAPIPVRLNITAN